MTEKKILSAVPVGGTLYKAGMENELSEVLTAGQVKYLTEQGAISGDFGTSKNHPVNSFPENYPGFDVLGQVEGMTPESVAGLSDEEILAIKGIGQKTLDAIRAYK